MSVYRGLAPRNDDDDIEVKRFATALRPRLLRHLVPVRWLSDGPYWDARAPVGLAATAVFGLLAVLALALSAHAG